MITYNYVLKNRYYDSVVLMSSSELIREKLGFAQVSLMMGTDANKAILKTAGLLNSEGEKAEPGDLLLSAQSEDSDVFEQLPAFLEEVLSPKAEADDESYFPRSLDTACEMLPGAGLALLSIPGEYVEWEGNKALNKGLHLMLFSDNVPLETEIMLKKKGEEKGLLVMGPDCGTSIIKGAALAFANVIRKGEIGIVAAAGTGIQEVSTLIHKMGGGITHAIGTGGRDLSLDVGGIAMKMGIDLLLKDPETKVLVLISKPPHPKVEESIFEKLKGAEKPVIINFLGSSGKEAKERGFVAAKTLEDAATLAMKALGKDPVLASPHNMDHLLEQETKKLASGQKYLRALYSGGTLCSETRIILEDMGLEIFSNVTKVPEFKLKDVFKSTKNTLVDMGDDDFTKGSPHPMIDNTKRIRRMMEEAEDSETAVMLIDVVLGYGSHPDPASDIASAAVKAQDIAKKAERHLIFISSVCGVDEDPQNAADQIAKLKAAGIWVFNSNAQAARAAGRIIEKL